MIHSRKTLQLRRMWIQDKGAAEKSIPISNTTGAWPTAKAAKEAKEAANQIKAKEAVKKDKRWNGLETEPFAEIWV